MAIVCDRVSLSYGDLTVFSELTARFPSGEVTAVLGPSGCGKTTLLQLIAGLLEPDAGAVYRQDGVGRHLRGENESGGAERGAGERRAASRDSGAEPRSSGAQEKSRRVSFIFQEPRLLPWMNARANVELVLERLCPREKRRRIAGDLLQRVGLSGFEGYYPHQLSGGMRQRVAVARAFAYPAPLMLLDEPFQALDLRRKLSVMEAFGELWRREGRTTVLVTHDIQEALILGDEIQLLDGNPARVSAVYRNPLARERRRLSDERLISLEHSLYEALAGDRHPAEGSGDA
jgi:NitT/TauT family transport system ATP-binding protein